MLQETALATEGRAGAETMMEYVGVPVRMRFLLGTDLDDDIPARVAVALDGWASDLEIIPLPADEDAEKLTSVGEALSYTLGKIGVDE